MRAAIRFARGRRGGRTVIGQLSIVEQSTNADAIAALLGLLLPDVRTVRDLTHGNGRFWSRKAGRPEVEAPALDPAATRHIWM